MHGCVFSPLLAHWISEVKKYIGTVKQGEKSEYGKKHSGQEKRCPDGLAVARAFGRPPGDRKSGY